MGFENFLGGVGSLSEEDVREFKVFDTTTFFSLVKTFLPETVDVPPFWNPAYAALVISSNLISL